MHWYQKGKYSWCSWLTPENCLNVDFVQFLSPTLLAIFLKFLSLYNPKFAGKRKEKCNGTCSPRSKCGSPTLTSYKKRPKRWEKNVTKSVAIEMSHLESTRNEPKPVRGKQERPLSKAISLSDLTGFRPLSEREKRQKKEDAIETVVEVHSAPSSPLMAPLWVWSSLMAQWS